MTAVKERPVTGSCGRCGHEYELPTPVPGSGDLQLQAYTDVMVWCAGCDQPVGRACCFGAGPICIHCAALEDSAEQEEPSGFAQVGFARAAIRGIDALLAGLASVDRHIAALSDDPQTRGEAAMDAWRAAWLALASLTLRIEQSRQAAESRIAALPSDEGARARELTDELEEVASAVSAAASARADDLIEAGRRLAARIGRIRPPSAKAITPAAPDPSQAVPISIPPSRPKPIAIVEQPQVTPVPVVVEARPPSTVVFTKAPRASVTLPTNGHPLATSQRHTTTPRPQATTTPRPIGGRTEVAVRGATASPRRPMSTTTPPAVPPQTSVPTASTPASAPRAHVLPPPAATREVAARPAWRGIVVPIVAMLVVAAGVVVVARWNELGFGQRQLSAPGVGDVGVPSARPIASQAMTTKSGSDTLSRALSFDFLTLGPLEAGAPQIGRIIGEPEVAPLPTAVDRSLRLRDGSGVCLPGPATAEEPTLAFTLLAEQTITGRIEVGLGDGSAAALDLTALDGSAQDEWHRITVRSDGTATGPSGTLQLPRAPDSAAAALSGERCIVAALDAADAAVFIDNIGPVP